MKNDHKALVLGGGGITGTAWELGLIAGLADLGVDLSGADILIGTSAGSVVGAQLTSGTPIEDLYQAQLDAPAGEIPARMSGGTILRYAIANLWPGDDRAARVRLGRQALSAQTVSEAERRAVIASRLPSPEWPAARLLVTAVDAVSGDEITFDRDSGVSLVDAVAASCAVPGVWPPVTINGRRYIDGGVRSIANADLARGYGRVVVLAPSTASGRRAGRIAHQVKSLGMHVHATIVTPTAEARKAMGANALDPALRAAAAKAGRAQAAGARDAVAVAWGAPPA